MFRLAKAELYHSTLIQYEKETPKVLSKIADYLSIEIAKLHDWDLKIYNKLKQMQYISTSEKYQLQQKQIKLHEKLSYLELKMDAVNYIFYSRDDGFSFLFDKEKPISEFNDPIIEIAVHNKQV